MDTSIILAVALAAAVIVVVLVLVCIIIYYRWQLGDKNATLGRFIDENAELRRKMRRTDAENDTSTDKRVINS